MKAFWLYVWECQWIKPKTDDCNLCIGFGIISEYPNKFATNVHFDEFLIGHLVFVIF